MSKDSKQPQEVPVVLRPFRYKGTNYTPDGPNNTFPAATQADYDAGRVILPSKLRGLSVDDHRARAAISAEFSALEKDLSAKEQEVAKLAGQLDDAQAKIADLERKVSSYKLENEKHLQKIAELQQLAKS